MREPRAMPLAQGRRALFTFAREGSDAPDVRARCPVVDRAALREWYGRAWREADARTVALLKARRVLLFLPRRSPVRCGERMSGSQ